MIELFFNFVLLCGLTPDTCTAHWFTGPARPPVVTGFKTEAECHIQAVEGMEVFSQIEADAIRAGRLTVQSGCFKAKEGFDGFETDEHAKKQFFNRLFRKPGLPL